MREIRRSADAAVYPHMAVAVLSERPARVARSRKKGGNNAAMTVVAKAELAQS
jgi:hypothetical protein